MTTKFYNLINCFMQKGWGNNKNKINKVSTHGNYKIFRESSNDIRRCLNENCNMRKK